MTEVGGTDAGDGWMTFTSEVYTQLPYSSLFRTSGFTDEWEHAEAKRTGITVTTDVPCATSAESKA